MSNQGVNTGFAKCFILFMALLILLEGAVYLALAIWGITQETCDQTTSLSSNPFKFVTDLIYFADEKCLPKLDFDFDFDTGNINPEDIVSMDWGKSHLITNRMYIFLIIYAVVSGLWVVTSLLVIATICGPVTKLISGICFWPWFLIVIGGSVLDAVATGYHVYDITQTTSSNKTFEYIGLNLNPEIPVTEFEQYDVYFITPAVVLTCISCRIVLIWVLNIFGVSFCLSLSKSIAKLNSSKRKQQQEMHATSNRAAPIVANAQTASEIVVEREQPKAITTQEVQYATTQPRPRPLSINNSQQQQQQQQQYNQQQVQRQPSYVPYSPAVSAVVATSPNNNNNNSNMQDNNMIADTTTYRTTDTHPDHLDYPSSQRQAMSVSTSPPTPYQPNANPAELSAFSPLNNRYGNEGPQYPTAPMFASSQPQRVSEELRSQLPWTYTANLKPQPPRKPQKLQQQQSQTTRPVSVYPDIPEPDYAHENNVRQPQSNSQEAYSRW